MRRLTTSPPSFLSLLAALTTTAALTLGALGSPASADTSSDEPAAPRPVGVPLSETEQALDRAAKALQGSVADDRVEATLALRDLFVARRSLDDDDAREADQLLARPTDGASDPYGDGYATGEAKACRAHICVHWVRSGADAPPNDAWAKKTLAVMEQVWKHHIGKLNYRKPAKDGSRGGNGKFDVYLKDVGKQGIYGYCAPERRVSGEDRQASGFCVLDNDFARSEFARAPLASLRVTAAHEFFHAIQFAYDFREDPWFLEATATWAEDEVFDGVNDNVQYLKHGPMNAPYLPLDLFQGNGLFQYGTWSFFRFLTEKYTAKQGGMPSLVLDMMKKVDGSLGAQDQYSWQAVENVLKTKKTTAAKQFLAFSVANRRPQQTYDEGKAQRYPTGPLAGRVKLSAKKSRTKVAQVTTDHLTAATYRFTPKNLKKKKTRLKVVLDMAPKKRGSMAAVTVVPKKGKTKVYTVKLNKQGKGTQRVPFSSRKVKYVEATLANTSGATTCFQDASSPYSCFGIPKHDRQKQRISGRVLK